MRRNVGRIHKVLHATPTMRVGKADGTSARSTVGPTYAAVAARTAAYTIDTVHFDSPIGQNETNPDGG